MIAMWFCVEGGMHDDLTTIWCCVDGWNAR